MTRAIPQPDHPAGTNPRQSAEYLVPPIQQVQRGATGNRIVLIAVRLRNFGPALFLSAVRASVTRPNPGVGLRVEVRMWLRCDPPEERQARV